MSGFVQIDERTFIALAAVTKVRIDDTALIVNFAQDLIILPRESDAARSIVDFIGARVAVAPTKKRKP